MGRARLSEPPGNPRCDARANEQPDAKGDITDRHDADPQDDLRRPVMLADPAHDVRLASRSAMHDDIARTGAERHNVEGFEALCLWRSSRG
jgi:hypothetical protein